MTEDLSRMALIRGLKVGLTNPGVSPQEFTEHFLETLDTHGQKCLEEMLAEGDTDHQKKLRHNFYQEWAIVKDKDMLAQSMLRNRYTAAGIEWARVKGHG